MDEYLSEKEQIQRLRDWWGDNGWYLVGGIVIGVAGILGYGRYQDYVRSSAEAAAGLYRELETAANDDNVGEVDRLLGMLRSEHAGSAYTDQGALLAARLLLVRDTARAEQELRSVMDSSDGELAMVARLRLARVLTYQERYAEALALLDVDAPGPFAARIADIRGDIYYASGDRDAARAAFTAALVAEGADLLDRNYLQMKLSDLSAAPPALAGNDAAAAAPSAALPVDGLSTDAAAAEAPAEAPGEAPGEAGAESLEPGASRVEDQG